MYATNTPTFTSSLPTRGCFRSIAPIASLTSTIEPWLVVLVRTCGQGDAGLELFTVWQEIQFNYII